MMSDCGTSALEDQVLETIRRIVREESSAISTRTRRVSESRSDDPKRRRLRDDYKSAQCTWCGEKLPLSVTYQMHNAVCWNNPALQRTCYVCDTSMHRSDLQKHQRQCRRRALVRAFGFLTSEQLDNATFCIELLHASRNTSVLETIRSLVNKTLDSGMRGYTEAVVHGLMHNLLTLWKFDDRLDRRKLRYTFAGYMKNACGCSEEVAEDLPFF